MGRNAQRKRLERVLKAVPNKRETTDERLRRRMKQVRSLEQFAQIVAAAPVLHQRKLRDLLTPMLPKDLPCCTLAKHGSHTPSCQQILEDMKAPAAVARFN